MTLLEDLRAMIQAYLSRSKTNSLRNFSLRSGVPYATLYKIHSGEIENPQLDTVMKLVREGLELKAERLNFVKRYYPHMYELMDIGGKDVATGEKARRVNEPDVDALFKNRDTFFLMHHLFSQPGISSDEVRECYGQHGLTLLQDLSEHEFVSCREGIWRTTFDYDFSSLEACRIQILNAASAFRQESVELGCGLLHCISEGVTLDAAQQISREISQCIAEIRKIRDANPGRHVFLANFAVQLLNPSLAKRERTTL